MSQFGGFVVIVRLCVVSVWLLSCLVVIFFVLVVLLMVSCSGVVFSASEPHGIQVVAPVEKTLVGVCEVAVAVGDLSGAVPLVELSAEIRASCCLMPFGWGEGSRVVSFLRLQPTIGMEIPTVSATSKKCRISYVNTNSL